MEVHYYAPYNFTLNDKSDIWQWGAKTTDPKARDSWGNEDYVDGQFQKMKQAFVDNGIPVLLGEYAAELKPRFPGMKPFRNDWDRYVTQSAARHGLVPMLWDVGTGKGIIDRTTGSQQDSELIQTIVDAVGNH